LRRQCRDFENIEQFFASRNLQIIVCGFEKELASADINDRFVVARFGVENHWVALKAIQQFAGIRQVRII
jgi:predicted transcriptional regulator